MKFEFVSSGKKTNIEGALLLTGGEDQYVEEKFDASRFGLELDMDGKWHAYSRGGVDRIDNIPYIVDDLQLLMLPRGTVLDCEVCVMHPDRQKRWELSRSVMGTKHYDPEAARATLLIFDIQHLGKDDLTSMSWLGRRAVIKNIFHDSILIQHDTYISTGYLAYTRAWPISQIKKLWTMIVDEEKGEGVMIKNNRVAKYGKDWNKVKKEHTIDAFILDITEGKGKYAGQIGTLEVAVYNGDVIWPIGKVSNVGDDATRKQMTEMALAGELKYKVIEIKFNEVTKNLKLRHGRFMRWRDDKPFKNCSLEQLKELR